MQDKGVTNQAAISDHTQQLLYCCRLGKLKCLWNKTGGAKCPASLSVFLCIRHPFPFPWLCQHCQPLVSPAGICVGAGRVWEGGCRVGQQAAAFCTHLLVAWALEIRSLVVQAWGSWRISHCGPRVGLEILVWAPVLKTSVWWKSVWVLLLSMSKFDLREML